MSFRKMRLVPEDQFQMGGAMDDDDEPSTKRKRTYEDSIENDPISNPVTIQNETPMTTITQSDPNNNSSDNFNIDKTVKQKRIERDGEKIIRLIKIALKIAKINSYDDELRIIGHNGEYVEGSNLADLLKYVLTSQKIIIGENEFIKILHDANVDPQWITNENVRARLLSLKNSNIKRKRDPTPPPPPQQPSQISSHTERIFKEPRRTFATIRDQFNKEQSNREILPENTPLPDDDDDELL